MAEDASLNHISDEELLKLRISVEQEMNSRGIRFSVGEFGEVIALNYFNNTRGMVNLMLAPKGAKNVDALSRDGERYSIKTVQRAKKTGTIYPDAIDKEKQLFEYLLLVQIDEKYELLSIHRFSWELFKQARAWDIRMNAWYVPVSKSRLDLAEQIYSKLTE